MKQRPIGMKTRRAFIKITGYVSLAYHEALLQPSHLYKERVNEYVCQTPFGAITLIRSISLQYSLEDWKKSHCQYHQWQSLHFKKEKTEVK